ncbi:MAG TPA: dihydroorotate dehydrogenase electron transfer subunit [Anaerolineae bacterium]|nr:dihydroorotate dehydrogenase electron transfer subunit [Anaerolineae bacterium]HQH39494.1 dihydroorotate dehydrogenase electron transfer subunit [Anaerolineae bacterium]
MHQTFTITEVHTENYRTKTFIFDRALPEAQPGQYVMAWLPDVGEKPFSIAGADPLALMVVVVGPFSEALHRLNVGDRVWVRGPLGQGFALRGRHHLLVGGGYGVAPLLFLARTALAAGHTVDVCIGARTARDVLLAGAFEKEAVSNQLSAVSPFIVVRVTTDNGSMGEKGLVTQAVEAAIAAHRPDGVYACGPVPMLTALAQQCRVHGLPYQCSWEAHLRCGLGLCGSCELETSTRQAAHIPAGWLVCKDGPVMRDG